jgi:hypothetical protein
MCWEWQLCPDTSYGWVDEDADELVTNESFLDWYGGWNFGVETIDSYDFDGDVWQGVPSFEE